MPGSAGGLTASGAFHQDPDLFGYQWGTGGKFGAAITIGHFFDQAGLPNQMVVGAPESAVCNGCPPSGLLYFVKDFTAPFAGDAWFFDQADLGTLGQDNSGDRFGHALDSGDWDNDGFDDLAVGIPGENITNESIRERVRPTRAASRCGSAVTRSSVRFRREHFSRGHHERLARVRSERGWAVAFGKFDDSGRCQPGDRGTAQGLPQLPHRGHDGRGGTGVHPGPVAPASRTPAPFLAVTDCNGLLLYAQRPFQSMPPASVTKAMTVLLAVEAFQAGAIDTGDVYTVPAWVATTSAAAMPDS